MGTGFDPLTIAAFTGVGSAAIGSLFASREQEKLDFATIEANREQAKLASAEKALSNAQNFRRSISSQLALANFRGGPGSSIASQFAGQAVSGFAQDQNLIARGARQIDTSSQIQRAGSALGRSSRDIGIGTNFASSLFSFANLSRLKGK